MAMHPSSHQAAYEPRADGYALVVEPTLRAAAERLAELAGARPGIRLLDIATGTGPAARAAAAEGATVAAVDLSPAMLEVARRRSPASIEFRLADVHELPYPDDAFDAVVCGLALSHFREIGRALGEIRRTLRPDGRLVASYWGLGTAFPSYRAALEVLTRYAAESSTASRTIPTRTRGSIPSVGAKSSAAQASR